MPPNFIRSSLLAQNKEHKTDSQNIQKILIVDDNKTNRHIARRMLETMNLPSNSCNDGTEAVDLANKEKFSAFLMDIQMPQMDGISATKEIRLNSLNKTTPVIAVSANCQNDMQSKFDAVGINAFLEKPYTHNQLKSLLGKFEIYERGNYKMPMEAIENIPAKDDSLIADLNNAADAISTQSDDTIIDFEMLSELEETLEIEGTIEIIAMCLEELAELCSNYQEFESSHDEAEKRRIAHKIKGCASSACAMALSTVASSIENADAHTLQKSTYGADLVATFEKTTNAFHSKYDFGETHIS